MVLASSSAARLPRKLILLIFINPAGDIGAAFCPGSHSPEAAGVGQMRGSYFSPLPYALPLPTAVWRLPQPFLQPSQGCSRDTLVGHQMAPALLSIRNTPLANTTSSSPLSMSPTQCCLGRRDSRRDPMPTSTVLEEVWRQEKRHRAHWRDDKGW